MSGIEVVERKRVGAIDGAAAGPTVVIVGGVHGNEPAGLVAGREVFERLALLAPQLKGRVVLLAGNVRALAEQRRYLGEDLNRRFQEPYLARLDHDPSPEAEEQRGLFVALREEAERSSSPLILLDLHSMSAPGPPFAVIGDTLRNRALAFALPIPVVLGLEEAIDGTLLEFVNGLGHVAIGVEGGRHDDPATVRRHVAVIWTILVAAGLLPETHVDLAAEQRPLLEAAGHLPDVMELIHREGVEPGDEFVMNPGYATGSAVKKGEVLAANRLGPVRSPATGFILLPLYQAVGADGFFLARSVWPFWLSVATACQRLRLHRILPLLPGIRRDTTDRNVLIASRRVARFGLVPVFHLLGFRKRREGEGFVAFVRRRPDHLPLLPFPRVAP